MTTDVTTDVLGPLDADFAERLRASPEGMRAGLQHAVTRGRDAWTGSFPDLVDALVSVARVDLCLARLVEGHADGLRILAEASCPEREGTYGVWASRSAGTGLAVDREERGWHVAGELRFASGIDLIDRALVSATYGDNHHVLLDISASLVAADRSSWPTTAMDASRSFTVTLDAEVPDTDQVGDIDFYLGRPGFVVGGLGVAAVWVGGAQHVADLVATSASRFPLSPLQHRRLGVIEQTVWQATALVTSAAGQLDDLTAEQTTRVVGQTRTAVVVACDHIIAEAALVAGPAGLSQDVRLARTLQDLALYVRQHHLDRELANLGERAIQERSVLAR